MRIETERLVLRGWQDKDRAPMAAIRADPIVRRFYQNVATRKETDQVIDTSIRKSAEGGLQFFAAERKADGVLLGMIGMARFDKDIVAAIPGHPEVEIGWQLGKDYWGQGYAPEGASACLNYAWDTVGLEEIVAITYRENLPSRRVMEKIGMTYDPVADFQHPTIPAGHPLRPHVLYCVRNPRL